MLEKEARKRERESESSCHSNYVGERGKEERKKERAVVFEVGIFLTFGHLEKKRESWEGSQTVQIGMAMG